MMSTLLASLVAGALKESAILVVALVAARLMRSAPAASRHALLFSALLAQLALPVMGAVLPGWSAPIPWASMVAWPPSARAVITAAPVASTWELPGGAAPGIYASSGGSDAVPAVRPGSATAIDYAPVAAPVAELAAPAEGAPPGYGTAAPTTGAPGSHDVISRWTLSAFGLSAVSLVMIVWAAGALIVIARLVSGIREVATLSRHATPVVDARWLSLVARTAGELRIARRVTLLRGSTLAVPVTWGILNPTILLPASADGWSSEQRRVVLLHELAHIKRRDALSQLLSQLALAVCWFNPLVWVSLRAMNGERERACDDYVLCAGTKPSAYVTTLVEMVRTLSPAGPASAALAMVRRSEFEGRMLAVLDSRVRRESAGPRGIASIGALVAMVVVPLAAVHPTAQRPGTFDIAPDAAIAALAPSRSGLAFSYDLLLALSAKLEGLGALAVVELALRLASLTASVDSVISRGEAPGPVLAARISAVSTSVDSLLRAVGRVYAGTDLDSARAPVEAVVAATAMATSAGPGAATQCRFNGGSYSSLSRSETKDRTLWTVSWSGDDCSVELRAIGELKLAEDLSDVLSISSGGEVEINVRERGSLRHLELRPGRDGGLERRWIVNGEERAYDAEARQWVADFLLALERQTGFSVEMRFPRLYAQGGVNAVLDEVTRLGSDHAKSRYLLKLLETARMDDRAAVRMIRRVEREIGGDFELARVLMKLAAVSDLESEESRRVFVTATTSIDADFERARTLLAVLEKPRPSREVAAAALQSASRIKADFELSRILVALAERRLIDADLQKAYLDAAASIEADFELSRVLLVLLDDQQLDRSHLLTVLNLARSIDADFEASRVLLAVAAYDAPFGNDLSQAYVKVVATIDAEHERTRAIKALEAKGVTVKLF